MTETISHTHLTTETQSPFLPGTTIQYAWDSTSLGLIKSCPRLYQYTIIDGWASREESVHLRFGIEYHAALQEYDVLRAQGQPHEAAVKSTVYRIVERTIDFAPNPETKAGRYKSRANLLGLVIDYLDKYEHDVLETYIMENGRPAVELSFRFELDFGPSSNEYVDVIGDPTSPVGMSEINLRPFLLCGHLDRVVTFNDTLFVMDHKTTLTTPGDHYFAQYEPNNQMTLYTFAGKVILHSPISGVCITAAQIKLEDPNAFVRGFTHRTPDQIEEWLGDLRLTLSLAEQYAEANYWPMNDTACDKFGGCKFRGVCSKSPEVREIFLKTDFDKLPLEERWNPLKSR